MVIIFTFCCIISLVYSTKSKYETDVGNIQHLVQLKSTNRQTSTISPSIFPSLSPTKKQSTLKPSISKSPKVSTVKPTAFKTNSNLPSIRSSPAPSVFPTIESTQLPTSSPSFLLSTSPIATPSESPSTIAPFPPPTGNPTKVTSSKLPTKTPSSKPQTKTPSSKPQTKTPSSKPSTKIPSSEPSIAKTYLPTSTSNQPTAEIANPFSRNLNYFVQPYVQEYLQSSIATATGEIASRLQNLLSLSTPLYISSISYIYGTTTKCLSVVLPIAAASPQKPLVTIGIYNLPNRDCSVSNSFLLYR